MKVSQVIQNIVCLLETGTLGAKAAAKITKTKDDLYFGKYSFSIKAGHLELLLKEYFNGLSINSKVFDNYKPYLNNLIVFKDDSNFCNMLQSIALKDGYFVELQDKLYKEVVPKFSDNPYNQLVLSSLHISRLPINILSHKTTAKYGTEDVIGTVDWTKGLCKVAIDFLDDWKLPNLKIKELINIGNSNPQLKLPITIFAQTFNESDFKRNSNINLKIDSFKV